MGHAGAVNSLIIPQIVQIFRDRAFRLFHNRLIDFLVRSFAYSLAYKAFNMLP